MADEDGPALYVTPTAAEAASGLDKTSEKSLFLADVASMGEHAAKQARKKRENKKNNRRNAQRNVTLKADIRSLRSKVQDLEEANCGLKVLTPLHGPAAAMMLLLILRACTHICLHPTGQCREPSAAVTGHQ